MSTIIFFLSAMVSFAAAESMPYSTEAQATEIKSLPGLPAQVGFRMFSGYITLDPLQTGIEGERAIFYWFVESQRSPSKDPLVLWTNGGPGCSGLAGFMTEQGPFRPTADGNLVENPHSWNKLANMVFIEQPAGVGFSYTKTKMNYTVRLLSSVVSCFDTGMVYLQDAQAAKDNAAFVRGFLQRYTAYNTSEFYITSESYGGLPAPVYTPAISV